MPLPERNIRNDRTNRIDLEARKTDRSTAHPASASMSSTPWDSLQRGHYAEARDQLRSMGCPEETIQDLLLMRIVGSHYDAWVRQLRAEAALQPWWRPQAQQYNRETQKAQRETRSELESLLGKRWRAILGDYFPAYSQPYEDWLSPERRQALTELQTSHQLREQELLASYPRVGLDDAGKAELMTFRRKTREEIEKLLSPAEQLEFNVRESRVANFVLGSMPEAKSEAEFRAMVEAACSTGIDFDIELLGNDQSHDGIKRLAEIKQRVLEEVQKRSTPERSEELAQIEADRLSAEKAAEETQAREQQQQAAEQLRVVLADAAMEAGANPEGVAPFIEALRVVGKEMEAKEAASVKTPGASKQFKAEAKAILERLAKEHFGAKGLDVLKRLPGYEN
jgi:hypothetical protein